MAYIEQRKNGWMAQVRKRGMRTLSRTFDLKTDAEAWAREVEREVQRGNRAVLRDDAGKITIDQVAALYAKHVLPKKRTTARHRTCARCLSGSGRGSWVLCAALMWRRGATTLRLLVIPRSRSSIGLPPSRTCSLMPSRKCPSPCLLATRCARFESQRSPRVETVACGPVNSMPCCAVRQPRGRK